MIATVSIVTTPGTYSPLNAEIWIGADSASSSVADFKYLFNVNTVDLITNVNTNIGSFKVPPRPVTGNGLFTPHKLLRSQLSYNIQPYISTTTPAAKSIVKYNIQYGFQYNPGDIYTSTYNGTGGRLGLNFGSTFSFEAGDIITITKDNKQSNPQYDGTASVYAIFQGGGLHLLETDKMYATSSVTDGGGEISGISRMQGTSSNYYGYNGTRQYNEIKTNFSNTHVVYNNANSVEFLTNYRTGQTGYPSSYSDFSTNYDYLCKKVYSNQYETLSFMCDVENISTGTVSLIARITGYDRLNNIQQAFLLPVPTTLNAGYRRYDLPVGPMNLVNGGYFASTQSQVIYNGGFTSSMGGWGNTSSNDLGSWATFSIATNQAVYSGDFDSVGLRLINNVTYFAPGVAYNFSIDVVTASSPYNNLSADIWIGTNKVSLTTTQIYTPGTYHFNIIAGGTQCSINTDSDGQGGSLTLDNLTFTRSDLPEYYKVAFVVPTYPFTTVKAIKYYHIVDNCSPYQTSPVTVAGLTLNGGVFRIAFLNRHGGFDYWNFNYKATSTFNVSKTEFRKVLDYNYSVGDRQDTVLSQKANETYLISSDWITQYDSEFLKELISSPEVYLIDEANLQQYPIIVTDSSYTSKTSIDNKLFCVTLSFKMAFDINLQQS